MLIETLCGVVFGIDQHGEYAQFGARDTKHSITQEDAAESFALIVLSYCQPS